MLRALTLLPVVLPTRAPADGASGTLGAGVVGPYEIAPGAVAPDRMAPLPEATVIGRAPGEGTGAPRALAAADLSAILAAERPVETLPSRAAAESADVPAGAAALMLLGHDAPGDGGGALWLRDEGGADAPWRFQSGDGAFWRLAASPAMPEMFGAAGDGETDDVIALETARDYCIATGAAMTLRAGRHYGVSRPFRILPEHNELTIEGPNGYSEGLLRRRLAAIRKLGGFPDAPAVEVGGPGLEPVVGLTLRGFEVHGGRQSGDGLKFWRTARLLVERVCTHSHPRGWGIVIDGGFFPTFVDCVSRNNGSTELGVGGGVLFANDERENADGRWIRGHVNYCGHRAVRFAGRSGNFVQANWTIQSTEINDSFGREPGFRLPVMVEVLGAWGVVFDHVRFSNNYASPERLRELVVVGDPASSDPVEDVTFRDCDFQHTMEDGDQWCIRARGRLKALRILNARQSGTAKFADFSQVTEGEVYEDCPAIAADRWNDPGRRIRNVRGGYVGPRPGSDGARFDVVPAGVGEALALGVRRSAGADAAVVRIGDGPSQQRMSLGDFALGLTPRAAPPASPVAGDVAYSDGSGGGFDGAGGAGLYVFKAGAGWTFVA